MCSDLHNIFDPFHPSEIQLLLNEPSCNKIKNKKIILAFM